MELVGRAEEIREVGDRLLVVFACCNHEVFELWLPPALKRIPPDTIVRLWSHRSENEDGSAGSELIIEHWEDLSRV